ncbi:MAG: site-specific integrase [Lachnospiraceae bacterium]|nr:site-specific integrase [Lachnospiraceae bacterium]
MALISCPERTHTISNAAGFCPSCGYPLKSTPKKRRKLPNGTGSIKHLSGRRSREWAAYPHVTKFSPNGSPILDPAIGYFKTYEEAYQALILYNAAKTMTQVSNKIILTGLPASTPPQYQNLTFAGLYELYYHNKYNNSKKKFSRSSVYSSKAAFNNCKALHERKFLELRKADLQRVIDDCPLKHSSLELIVTLFKGMYSYALQNDIIEKDYSKYVSINIADDDECGVPFSQAALETLWKNKHHKNVGMILLMIYTGFRISAYKDIRYDKEGEFFQGGVKTASAKNRIVPLHPAIRGFALNFFNRFHSESSENFHAHKCRREFYEALGALNLTFSDSGTKHTPHDCRHTFSWLCDKYKVDELSKHLLMGHSLSGDIERSVYGHRTLDELRAEIEKIQVPYCR